MKPATKLFASLLLSFFWFNGFAQNISNKGTDFWVGYGHHHFMENNGNGQDMTLYLSVKQEDLQGKPYATVTVEVDSSGVNYSLWWRRIYHIVGNKVIDIVDDNAFSTSFASVGLKGAIPKDVATGSGKDFRLYTDVCPLGTGGMGVFKGKGIHITSDVPIVAYSHIYGSTSSGATMLLPTDSWGYTYRTLNSKHLGYDHCFNWFFIVAKENNTRVRITPAGRPRAQNNCSFTQPTAGVPYIVNLQKGEIYQYIGYVVSETASPTVGDDLTGSMVESIPNDSGYCKKIAVFAGDSRTSGETLTSSSKDNDMQQCFPEHTWGKKYATNPWATETGGINACGAANTYYKVIAKDEGTTISINAGPQIAVSNVVGTFYRFSNSTPNYIVSNKPIMVAQYMESGNGGGQGDPEMVYLSPIEQSITNVGLFRQTRESISSNFVSIIIPDSGLASLSINGFKNANVPPFGANACVKNHPNLPGYKIVVKGWTSLNEQVNVTSDAGFNIITYGLGGAESYAYSGGAYFNVLAVDPKVTNQCDTFSTQAQWDTTYHGQTFDGTAFDLKGEALFAARRLDWLFGQIDTTKFTIKRECDGVKNTDYADSMSGSYLYQPPSYCTGYDTFYMRGCDANTNNCQYQMHVVTIGTPLAIKAGPVRKTVNLNQTIGGNCTAEIGATGGIKPYNYNNINAPSNKSTRGGSARVTNVTTGLYTYTPPLNYVGLDTFYLKVCDLSCGTNCLTQMYIVTVGPQFVASSATIRNAIYVDKRKRNILDIDSLIYRAAINTGSNLIINSAQIFSPSLNSFPYNYKILNTKNVIKDTTTNNNFVNINVSSGVLQFNPLNGFSGVDSFYVEICDASTVTHCVKILVIISVGQSSFNANSGTESIALNQKDTLDAYMAQHFSATGVNGNYTYATVDNLGNSTTLSTKLGVVQINSQNGHLIYIPPSTSGLSTDTFYVKLCDATNHCVTKTLVVSLFTKTLKDSAALEAQPTGGNNVYRYAITAKDSSKTPTSFFGASVIIDSLTGIYTYTALPNFVGYDTFYVQTSDTVPGPGGRNRVYQMHIIYVGDNPFSINNFNDTLTSSINTLFTTDAVKFIKPYGGIGIYRYKIVDANGLPKNTSTKGASVTIKQVNSTMTYTPINNFTGYDSLYIQVCDSASLNCKIKLFTIKIDTVLSGQNLFKLDTAFSGSSVSDTALKQIGAKNGVKSYRFSLVDENGFPTLTSKFGVTVNLTSDSGIYKYTAKPNFVGIDYFYVKLYDNSTNPSYVIQKHTVYVFPSILAPTPVVVNHSVSVNGQFEGNAKADMPTLTGATPFKYQDVYSNGGLTNISSRNGLVYIMPLPLRTIAQASGLVDTHYVYRALSCNYIIEKKNGSIDKIDSLYLPVVIYKKPVNGIPVGCYGAGGIVGDTVKMLLRVFPKPRLNKNVVSVPVCPTDSTITFTADTISANNTPFKYKATRYSWLITGTLHNLPVSYTDTHRICAYSFDTGTMVTARLTTSFQKGACGYYDTSFKFQIGRIRFVVKPISHTICLGGAFKIFDSTAAPLGKDSSYWEMGNGDNFYKPPTDTFSYTYTTAGTYYIGHRIKIIGCNQVLPLDSIKVVVTSKLKPVIAYPTTCIDTSGLANFWFDSIATGVSAQTFNWTFGDPASGALNTSTINPTSHIYPKDTIYQVKLYVKDNISGCDGDTTISVTIGIKPNLIFNTVTAGWCINNGTIDLTAYAKCLNQARANGSGTFKGPGTSTTGIFDPKLSGIGTHTVWYVYTSRGGCADSVSQQIIVNDTPHLDFDYTKGCLPKTGIAHFTNLSVGGFSFIWNFDDPTHPNNIFVDSIDATRKFYDTRLYNVKLYSETDKGCKDSLIKPITFSVTPEVNYPAFPAAGICENQTNYPVNTATITNGVTLTSGNYYGNGVSLTGVLSPAVSGYGNDSITYIATSTGGCADTAVQYILVKARPRIGFTYPAGCLPANGIVQFTDTSKMPDTQTIQSCTWNFGHSSAGNPGTANICSPSHTYPYGTYTIYHTVTSSLGCVTDTTFNATFSISPNLTYGAIPTVCENITSHSVAYGSCTNAAAVPGTGEYHGVGITNVSTGDFNPFVAGAGTHIIWYVYTATSGCKDSVSSTVIVNARPKGQFTFTPNGCLNASGTVQFDASAITVAGSSVTAYNWQFETPSPVVNGINPTHNYSDGTYTISLNTTAANGCSFDTAQTVTFGRLPSLGSFTHSSVCENGGIITIAGATVTNGALLKDSSFHSSKGAFIDSVAGKYDPSIAGYGVDTITYTVTSIGNCKATATLYLTIDARPRGQFVFTPNGTCLDTAGIVQFDASGITIPNSSITSYTWNFGNGTGSGVNPTNVYNEGSYTIKLNVQGANSCTFDTSLTTTFKRTPHLDTISLAYICTNGGNTTVASPKILNGVGGTGVFSSSKNAFINTSTGDYDPNKAGFGNDLITYTFTSTGGCVATTTFNATIKSRPTGTFTYSPLTGCLNTNGTVQFDASSFTAPLSSVSGYTWDFGSSPNAGTGVNPTHDYNDGTYLIKLRVDAANGCWFDTSMTATFNKTPLLDTIPSINPCENGGTVNLTAPKILNGATGTGVFSSYKNAATAAGVYDPSKAGYGTDTIYYTLTSAGGCSATQKLAITVKARPYGTFTFTPNSGCLDVTGKVNFTSNINVPNSSVQKYDWLFENGSIPGTGANPSHNYTDGSFTIKLTTTGTNGCSSDTSLTTTFNRTPLLDNLVQQPICENGGTITLVAPNVLNSVAGTGVFSSFKGAATATGTYDPSISSYGVDTIYYTYTSTAGCSAMKKLAITVKARPRGTFTFTPNTGCLDANGLVRFDASAITVIGSSVKTYTWDFEAPSGIGGNLGVKPTYNYADGTYDIKLNVLGNNNCSFDTMMSQKFSKTPSLDPIVTKNVCANDAPFALTPPNVNNGVAGPTGIFTSFRNAVTGNSAVGYTYTPIVGSYIIDTIYYKFTSNNGCITSNKKVININPVPQIKLKVSSDVCRDTITILRDMSTIKSGHIDSTWWHFYDSTYVNPTAGLITRNFDSAAVYSIYFTAKSDSGCITNDSAKITVRPQPKAMFEFGSVVCMPQGTVFFTNKSSIDSLGGTMGYSWNFGDAIGATSSNPNTSGTRDTKHTYGIAKDYPVRLTVGSKEYGCFNVYDDTLKLQKPFYLKPIARFDVTKDTLCEGEFTTFFDTSSTATGSNLFSWTWDYGDGSTPNTTTVPNATYAYSTASSSYVSSLVVRNTQLCESEPATKTIVVYTTPKIDSIPVIYAVDGSVVQFKPRVTDSINTSFSWVAPAPYGVVGLSNPNVLRPYLSVTQYPPFGVSNPSQLYTLYAQGQYNCTDSAVQVVKILGKIIVPNAFSPNGDGINDKWIITSLADYPGAVLDIYDRYGLKVQHLVGGNLVWDGTINGAPAPVATYYYVIDPGNNMPLVTGWVVLLR